MVKRKCVKGWGCGNSCISRTKKCRSNLDDTGKKLTETFFSYIQRTQKPGELADQPSLPDKPKPTSELDKLGEIDGFSLPSNPVKRKLITDNIKFSGKQDYDQFPRDLTNDEAELIKELIPTKNLSGGIEANSVSDRLRYGPLSDTVRNLTQAQILDRGQAMGVSGTLGYLSQLRNAKTQLSEDDELQPLFDTMIANGEERVKVLWRKSDDNTKAKLLEQISVGSKLKNINDVTQGLLSWQSPTEENTPSTEENTPTTTQQPGSLKPFGETETYKKNLEARNSRILQELDGDQELLDKINNSFKQIFDEQGYEPVVYISVKTLNTIAASPPEEQRLKNQFETGTSGGSLNAANRRFTEDEILGFKSGFTYDSFGDPVEEIIIDPDDGSLISGPNDPLTPRQRPIYTGFQPIDQDRFQQYEQYGNVAMRIKNLSPDDYTITGDDSLNNFTSANSLERDDKISGTTRSNFTLASMDDDIDKPSGLNDLYNFLKDQNSDKDVLANAIAKHFVDELSESMMGYFEAQIMKDITPDMLEVIENRDYISLSPEAKKLFNMDDSEKAKKLKSPPPEPKDKAITTIDELKAFHKELADLLASMDDS